MPSRTVSYAMNATAIPARRTRARVIAISIGKRTPAGRNNEAVVLCRRDRGKRLLPVGDETLDGEALLRYASCSLAELASELRIVQ